MSYDQGSSSALESKQKTLEYICLGGILHWHAVCSIYFVFQDCLSDKKLCRRSRDVTLPSDFFFPFLCYSFSLEWNRVENINCLSLKYIFLMVHKKKCRGSGWNLQKALTLLPFEIGPCVRFWAKREEKSLNVNLSFWQNVS